MFEPLFVYAETDIDVQISGAGGESAIERRRLAEDRASQVVDYLVDRGLERERFRVVVEPVIEADGEAGGALPEAEQRVRVSAVPRRS